MKSFNIEELIGTFEAVEEQDEKISDLNSQIKMLRDDNAQRFADFAKDKETKPKYIKSLYTHWREAKCQDKPTEENDDLYTLMAQLDMYLEKQNENDKED